MAVSRRQLVTGLGGGAVALSLAACDRNSGSGDGTSSAGATGTPRTGGTLRVGALGTGGAITKDAHGLLSNNSDMLLMSLVYEALLVPGADPGTPVAGRLVKKWSVAKDARTWTFELEPKARFHDGSPVTADDVVWSMKRIIQDKKAPWKVPVPPSAISATRRHTVRMVSTEPNSQLPLLLRLVTFTMPKGTTDPEKLIGSGPFKVERYQNGNARLVRADTWHGDKPRLEAIEITRFDSADAMNNALVAGQLDLATGAGPVGARVAAKQPDLVVRRRKDDMALPIIMRVADGPFADARVREAVRLAVDRPAMVRSVLSGYGSVANDVLGTADPMYDRSIPQRTRNLARARTLLKQAGLDTSKTYPLYTVDEAYGQVDGAKLFARQVAAAGIKVKVVTQDSATFYDKTWCKADLYTMAWGTNDSVAFYAQKVLNSKTENNETGWKSKEFDAAYQRLLSATTPTAQRAASREMQQIQHDSSGYLLWGMADGVDISRRNVGGLPTGPGFSWVLLDRAYLTS